MAVTAGGQRLLLGHADATVRYDAARGALVSNRPGWWLINVPWNEIQGLADDDRDEVARRLFGRPLSEVRNWWLRTPGDAAPEPPEPTGPAPFRPHSAASWVVDPRHPAASDDGAGTAEAPLRTIGAAVSRAVPGSVIQVHPGVYREAVVAKVAGTPERPIVVEGVRGPDGALPVITGNDPAPPNAWQRVQHWERLWRAENWTGIPANLAVDGRLLRERSLATVLEPGEYAHNYAARALSCLCGLPEDDAAWREVDVGADGFLDLGEARGVYYLSACLWLPPDEKRAEVWDPRFPQPLTGNVRVAGGFRAGRTSSVGFAGQLNLYRLWINGDIMPAAGRAGEPRAHTDYGRDGDQWQRLPFQEGWNRIEILLDSRANRSVPNRLRFGIPEGRSETVSRAGNGRHPGWDPPGSEERKAKFVTQWRVRGPVLAEDPEPSSIAPERAVYLRLEPGQDPNALALDLGVRKTLVELRQPHWTVRGFEIRHGTQYQQSAAVVLGAPGVVFEHNVVREPEVRCISLVTSAYANDAPPMVLRGNWLLSPGSLGIGASGDSAKLTPDNLASPPGRGRVLIEHNHILNNNRSGYARFWESGAMKLFRLTGSVIRHNTVIEGDGPAIWLDWEHYGNRIEGNLLVRPTAFGVGVEASPGPNLICNNVVIGTRPGGQWFRYALLAWSSARVWAVGNTIDGPHGIQFAEGQDDRKTRWGALPERDAAVVNNLVLGRPVSLHRGRLRPVAGNRLYGPKPSGLQGYTRWKDAEWGTTVEQSAQMGGGELPTHFAGPERGDYRFPPDADDAAAGVGRLAVTTQGANVELVGLVRYDFFGLPRLAEDGVPAGAFRNEPAVPAGAVQQIEVEFADGTLTRRWLPSKETP
jgi:hypothetical protein